MIWLGLNTLCYFNYLIQEENSSNTMLLRSMYLSDYLLTELKYKGVFQLMNGFNYKLLNLIGKVLLAFYLPLGLVEFTKEIINSLTNKTIVVKRQKNQLNGNFNNSYDLVKKLNTKQMSGVSLSKQEIILLNQAKLQIEMLGHKQDIIEEKLSKFNLIMNYLKYPINLVNSIFFIVILTSYLGTKFVNSVNAIMSPCGFECGFIDSNSQNNILQNFVLSLYNPLGINTDLSFQGADKVEAVLEIFKFHTAYLVPFSIYIIFSIFAIKSALLAVKRHGIWVIYPLKLKNYSFSEVKVSKELSFGYYVNFGLMLSSLISQTISLFPDFAIFGFSAKSCEIASLGFSIGNCHLTSLGKTQLSENLNFETMTLVVIGVEWLMLISCVFRLGHFMIMSDEKEGGINQKA